MTPRSWPKKVDDQPQSKHLGLTGLSRQVCSHILDRIYLHVLRSFVILPTWFIPMRFQNLNFQPPSSIWNLQRTLDFLMIKATYLQRTQTCFPSLLMQRIRTLWKSNNPSLQVLTQSTVGVIGVSQQQKPKTHGNLDKCDSDSFHNQQRRIHAGTSDLLSRRKLWTIAGSLEMWMNAFMHQIRHHQTFSSTNHHENLWWKTHFKNIDRSCPKVVTSASHAKLAEIHQINPNKMKL